VLKCAGVARALVSASLPAPVVRRGAVADATLSCGEKI